MMMWMNGMKEGKERTGGGVSNKVFVRELMVVLQWKSKQVVVGRCGVEEARAGTMGQKDRKGRKVKENTQCDTQCISTTKQLGKTRTSDQLERTDR